MSADTHRKLNEVIEADLAGLSPALRAMVEKAMPLLMPLITKWLRLGWGEYVGVSFSEDTDIPLPRPIEIALTEMERIKPPALTEQQMGYTEDDGPYYMKSDE